MVDNLPKMTGKVVAVTGCTSGTGKIFAQVGVVNETSSRKEGFLLTSNWPVGNFNDFGIGAGDAKLCVYLMLLMFLNLQTFRG